MAKRPAPRAAGSTPAAQASPAPTAAALAAAQVEADRVAADKAAADKAEADRVAAELGGFDMDGRTIFVRSASPHGRRRAGLAFGATPVPVRVDELTDEQLTAILWDSDLVIVAVEE